MELNKIMKKQKPIIRHAHEKLFNADILLIICEWKDFYNEASKILDKKVAKNEEFEKRYKTHGEDYYGKGCQFPFSGGGSVIWIKPNEEIGTLVHEMVHTAHHLLKCRTVPLSEDTEEVYAYLIEFLFNNIVKGK